MQSSTFTDFDAFADSVRDVDAEMMFQNAKRRRWTINHVFLPETHVQLGRLGSGNIVEGQSWSNGYLLYLPLSGNCEYRANGTLVGKGSFMILEPGCDFCVATRAEHDWCSIFVPTHRFAAAADEHSSRTGQMICRVSHANLEAAGQFCLLVDQIMTTAAKYPKFESSPAAKHVEAELLNVASAVVGRPLEGQHHQPGRPLTPRHEIVGRCKQLLEERDTEPIRVDELAAVAAVCQRTLRRAFNEYYGVGPVRFLQLRQLNQVHRVLKASDADETTITDVLFALGVSEPGRFASRYRARFGELPSETLKAKRR